LLLSSLATPRGSICSDADKAESRAKLVAALRSFMEVLQVFVTGNPKNQQLVFLDLLPALRKHLGLLQLPTAALAPEFDRTVRASLAVAPGLDSESVSR